MHLGYSKAKKENSWQYGKKNKKEEINLKQEIFDKKKREETIQTNISHYWTEYGVDVARMSSYLASISCKSLDEIVYGSPSETEKEMIKIALPKEIIYFIKYPDKEKSVKSISQVVRSSVFLGLAIYALTLKKDLSEVEKLKNKLSYFSDPIEKAIIEQNDAIDFGCFGKLKRVNVRIDSWLVSSVAKFASENNVSSADIFRLFIFMAIMTSDFFCEKQEFSKLRGMVSKELTEFKENVLAWKKCLETYFENKKSNKI